jgi:hypothetical protein
LYGKPLNNPLTLVELMIIFFRTKSGMSYAKGKNDIDFDEGMEPPLESAIKTK